MKFFMMFMCLAKYFWCHRHIGARCGVRIFRKKETYQSQTLTVEPFGVVFQRPLEAVLFSARR